jgi:hypothetical protein
MTDRLTGSLGGRSMPLPTTDIRGLKVSRLVVGGNPISGFSHSSPERTKAMLDYFTVENCKRLLRRCEEAGINTAFLRADNHVMRLLREYWNEGGTIQWVAQTVPGEDPVMNIDRAKLFGASGIYLHGGTIDGEFERGRQDEVRKLLEHVKSLGIPAGCASHVPENILDVERRGWEPDFYMVSLYNISGYRGKLGVEQDEKFNHADRAKALDAIAAVKRPCFAYKILAAGRRNAREAFREVFSRMKPTDGVNVGMFPPDSKTGDIAAENAAYVTEFARA